MENLQGLGGARVEKVPTRSPTDTRPGIGKLFGTKLSISSKVLAFMKVSSRSWTFLSTRELIIFTASARRVVQDEGSNILKDLFLEMGSFGGNDKKHRKLT